jgi:hypothetical protein
VSGARAHRLVREVATQVLGEGGDRRVALGRALLQGLGDDVVEVASKQAPQLLGVAARRAAMSSSAPAGMRAGRRDRLGQTRRRCLDDRLDELGVRARGRARRCWPPSST